MIKKIIFSMLMIVIFLGCGSGGDNKGSISIFGERSEHKNIITTLFWVGEKSNSDNGFISNIPSAWDDNWATNFGGVDNPNNRIGFFPKFTPKENPFYFALPYNDFTDSYERKENAKYIPWFSEAREGVSICKNRWIKITKDGLSAYAQWEDVGPFGEDDFDYVFGTARPKNELKSKAGLDISPAVKEYLGLNQVDKTDWEFVEFSEVPDGPWKDIITY